MTQKIKEIKDHREIKIKDRKEIEMRDRRQIKINQAEALASGKLGRSLRAILCTFM